jgi:hypothetical protein
LPRDLPADAAVPAPLQGLPAHAVVRAPLQYLRPDAVVPAVPAVPVPPQEDLPADAAARLQDLPP